MSSISEYIKGENVLQVLDSIPSMHQNGYMSEMVLKGTAKHKTVIWPLQHSVKHTPVKYEVVKLQRLSQKRKE